MTEPTKHEDRAAEGPKNNRTQDPRTVASEHVGDLVGGALFAALGIFAVIAAVGMPRRGNLGFFTSPGFVPLLLGTLLIFLSGILVFKSLRAGALSEVGYWLRSFKDSEESRRVFVLVLLLIAYVAVIGTLNFVLATLLFSLAALYYVKAGKLWQILLYSVLIATLAGGVIPYVFSMPLP